jgi:hypothetical protein
VLTAPEAIALLNQRRTANGIPGDLVEGSSDLADDAIWGPLFNPWSGAALHMASLMDPAVTTVWYGAGPGGACMGTSGARPFTTAAFYSVPGPGATNVPIAEDTGELPFSPQQAVGLGSDAYLAPAIPLWAEDTPGAELQTATLATTKGARVPTSLVTPETPTPPSPAGWPTVGTFRGYTTASFVVPRVKLKANTSYVLTATWQTDSGAATQTVPFKTAATDLNNALTAFLQERIEERIAQVTGIEPGSFTPTLTGRTLTIQATGLAIGRAMTVKMVSCAMRGKCMYLGPSHVLLNRAVRLTTTPVRLVIPRTPRGKRSYLGLSIAPFKVKGEHIYPYSTSAVIPGRH